jgi:hypothetical protein
MNCVRTNPKVKNHVEFDLTWAIESISAGGPASEPVTSNDKPVVVVTLVGTRQAIDQFDFYVFGSEAARGCRVRAKTSIRVNI